MLMMMNLLYAFLYGERRAAAVLADTDNYEA